MKQNFKTWLVVGALSFLSFSSFGQQEKPVVPKWFSEKGYWVIESNIYSPLNHLIRFYNNDNVLLYKETITGVQLNPSKRKVKMKLKKVLESTILVWEQKKAAEEDKNYVSSILGLRG